MLRFMEADRVRIRDLEDQIVDIERSLSELRAQQAQVQERLDAYKYPVLTLPNEITSKIFGHFLPVYPTAPPLTGRASPTTLTCVCRRWREVALATPALWRAIRLNYKSRVRGYKHHRISDVWIKRSGSCPLSVQIDIFHDILPEVFTDTMAVASARAENLRLWIPCHSHPKIGSMPLLRSLTLAFQPGDEVFTYDAPQLRTVVLLGGVVQHVILPWAQLTCLALNSVKIIQCASILRQTKNLVRCDLRLGRYDQPDELLDSPSPDLTLPCLQSLTLKTTLERMDGFLAVFVVPALSKFDLHEIFLGIKQIEALETFISKSGCRLQEVCIRGKNTTDEYLYRQAFPSISTCYRYLRSPWFGSDEDDSQSEDDSESEAHSDSSEQFESDSD
ncbi:hypothetical protein C8R45DRAFT_1222139 [Mycena sanguinolenta]|nr:hypothetical protein C8R45DRAFT_1222139 [Mycena sanguinolenta]